MTLYFITGNKRKFEQVRDILAPISIEQLDIDLPEIQEIDSRKIIEQKVKEALVHKTGEFIVEDTSLHLKCLNRLPGPLIKWFEKSLGNQGIFEMVQKLGDDNAETICMIGYAKNLDEIHYFEGNMKGRIVSPRGNNNFGWGPIFEIEGHGRTFSEMTDEEINKISHRNIAVMKLKEYLERK